MLGAGLGVGVGWCEGHGAGREWHLDADAVVPYGHPAAVAHLDQQRVASDEDEVALAHLGRGRGRGRGRRRGRGKGSGGGGGG